MLTGINHADMNQAPPLVSIVIKAFNEEELIGRCIESALAATEGVAAEIIIADSLSIDKTVEIAGHYPVKIVQLLDVAHRGAGAAAQLGYQFACGRYIYILDGDMEMQPGFLKNAIALLESDPELAGVAGILQDTRVNNMFDRHRVKTKPSAQPGYVPWLGGGGLYRKKAIESVGYIAHRFLPAYEEAELGMRLGVKGWKLMRLPDIAVSHTGHDESTFGMLRRMWRNGYAKSGGMLFRSAVGKEYLARVIKSQKHALIILTLIAGLITGIAIAPHTYAPLFLVAFFWISAFMMLLIKKRDLIDSLFSFFQWHYFAAGFALGMLHKIGDPNEAIPAVVVKG